MFKRLVCLSLLFTSSLIAAEATSNSISSEHQKVLENWTAFRTLISKAKDEKIGESEYEKSVRLKLLDLTEKPFQNLINTTKGTETDRQNVLMEVQKLAPLINIWNEEWSRAIELRQLQTQVQLTGDNDLATELAQNLNHSIEMRQHQLGLLEHSHDYQTIITRVKRQAERILTLRDQNQSQAKMIETLKKQLELAQQKSHAAATPKPEPQAIATPKPKAPPEPAKKEATPPKPAATKPPENNPETKTPQPQANPEKPRVDGGS